MPCWFKGFSHTFINIFGFCMTQNTYRIFSNSAEFFEMPPNKVKNSECDKANEETMWKTVINCE